jgi:hypothetical protein
VAGRGGGGGLIGVGACDPHQGRGRTHSGGRPAGGHEVAEAPADGSSALRRGRSRGPSWPAPSVRPRCW